ncbi:MAG: hypothetical protein ACRENP_17975 [Longimicrobiales bacterium]
MPLRAPEEPYKFFERLAHRQVNIREGPNASNEGSRDVTVVPLATESQLRQREWMDNYRQIGRSSAHPGRHDYPAGTASAGPGGLLMLFILSM